MNMHKSLVNSSKGNIVCNVCVGDRLERIKGLGCFEKAFEYKVIGEYPYHYLIGIKYRTGLEPDWRNYISVSVSKASIYCGSIVLIKESGKRVEAFPNRYSI